MGGMNIQVMPVHLNQNNVVMMANNTNGVNHEANQQQPRTLYVGNLDSQVTDDLLHALFGQMGVVNGVKIIHEGSSGNSDPYAFIEFTEHSSASNAIMTMNKRQCLGRELKVNWATSPGAGSGGQQKPDTSKHYHIFIGDLSPEIETQQLRDAFSPFGEISDCRVVRDANTQKSKGYGFVSFVKKSDAEVAINTMNGSWLGSRPIRTNWATRKPPNNSRLSMSSADGSIGPVSTNSSGRMLSFDEVYHQSSPTNCTVYCGGILQGLSEDLISKSFCHFGVIQEIRVFKDKGYAFIKFGSKEAATNAIINMHLAEINGQIVKCSWGKETGDPNNLQANLALGLAAAAALNPHHMAGHPGAMNPMTAQAALAAQLSAYGLQTASPGASGYGTAAGYPGGAAAAMGYWYGAYGGQQAAGQFNPQAAAAAAGGQSTPGGYNPYGQYYAAAAGQQQGQSAANHGANHGGNHHQGMQQHHQQQQQQINWMAHPGVAHGNGANNGHPPQQQQQQPQYPPQLQPYQAP